MNATITNTRPFTHAAIATGSPTTGAVRAVIRQVATWQRRHADRRALLDMTDAMLLDTGLTRAEIDREAAKPFWVA